MLIGGGVGHNAVKSCILFITSRLARAARCQWGQSVSADCSSKTGTLPKYMGIRAPDRGEVSCVNIWPKMFQSSVVENLERGGSCADMW